MQRKRYIKMCFWTRPGQMFGFPDSWLAHSALWFWSYFHMLLLRLIGNHFTMFLFFLQMDREIFLNRVQGSYVPYFKKCVKNLSSIGEVTVHHHSKQFEQHHETALTVFSCNHCPEIIYGSLKDTLKHSFLTHTEWWPFDPFVNPSVNRPSWPPPDCWCIHKPRDSQVSQCALSSCPSHTHAHTNLHTHSHIIY